LSRRARRNNRDMIRIMAFSVWLLIVFCGNFPNASEYEPNEVEICRPGGRPREEV